MNAYAFLREADVQLASAKRGLSERKGVHAWHPYYAGYSERFVETALQYLGCVKGNTVVDPWAGSGTTGLMASRAGIDCICFDINPVMASFAGAKARSVLENRDAIETWLRTLPCRFVGETESGEPEPLTNIFEAATATHFRAILRSIPFNEHTSPSVHLLKENVLNPCHAFCRAVIFATIRQTSGIQKRQNPTWIRTRMEKAHVSESHLFSALRTNGKAMLDQLAEAYHGVFKAGIFSALNGDARALPIKDASIDAVITSPPYLTRIDYAVSTFPEMMTFGDNKLMESVRHKTMGAPVITKTQRTQQTRWGQLCNEVLDAIKSHNTKAASSYYWKNIIQYFIDMDASLVEIKRILKPGASALIVVQSSYFKEIEIPLGDIYVQAARGLGLDAGIVAREEIKTHMAHVNTRSNQYKLNKIYYEDIVEVRKY